MSRTYRKSYETQTYTNIDTYIKNFHNNIYTWTNFIYKWYTIEEVIKQTKNCYIRSTRDGYDINNWKYDYRHMTNKKIRKFNKKIQKNIDIYEDWYNMDLINKSNGKKYLWILD